jgi:hypothetical protein
VASSDDFTWSVRVRAAGRGRATAYVRKSSFEVGIPLQFDPEYERVSALELLLAALGADLVNGLTELARRARVEIHDVEAVVSGRLNNPLTHLAVVGEQGHPGLQQAAVRVYVGSDAEESAVRALWDQTLARSPLVHTLKGAAALDLSLTLTI